MSKTLREKLLKGYAHEGIFGCDGKGAMATVADHVDAIAKRVNAIYANLAGLENRAVEQSDMHNALSRRLDAAIADGLARMGELERSLGTVNDNCNYNYGLIKVLKKDLTTLAGADVPSGPEEFIRPDEPSSEGANSVERKPLKERIMERLESTKQDKTSGLNAVFGCMPDLEVEEFIRDIQEHRHPTVRVADLRYAIVDLGTEALDNVVQVLEAAGVNVVEDEPDLEGEAMSPDYEADRDEAEEPDRPWREEAEACLKCIDTKCDLSGGFSYDEMTEASGIIESAIEKAVEEKSKLASSLYSTGLEQFRKFIATRKERDALKKEIASRKGNEKSLILEKKRISEREEATSQKLATLQQDHMAMEDETRALKAEVAELKESNEALLQQGGHATVVLANRMNKELKAEVERRQNESLELHAKMGEWTDKAIRRADEIAELEAEVKRLKAAKPKVAALTREEMMACLTPHLESVPRAYPAPNIFCVMATKAVDAILALQAKKAAEMEQEGGGA